MLYFAYGSNMDWDQMRNRCPSARFKCTASLKDHKLAFTRYSGGRKCGVADAVPHEGHDVWGVVYQIEEVDIGRLDRSEGFKPGRPLEQNAYRREQRHVYDDDDQGSPLLVSLYFANKEDDPPLPNAAYKELIVKGAQHWHLPTEYIAELEQIKVHG